MEQRVIFEESRVAAQSSLRLRGAPLTYAGLCSSCDHAPYCTFRRFAGQTVLHCEEWSGETVALGTLGQPGLCEPPSRTVAALRLPNPLPKGLCATCEEYRTCAFAKPKSGVWHCEEYR